MEKKLALAGLPCVHEIPAVQPLPNRFHLETDTGQALVVQQFPSVEYIRGLHHHFVQKIVIKLLQRNIRIKN